MAGKDEPNIIKTPMDTYQINFKDRLGDGAFAVVYSAYSKKRKGVVAVKVVKKKELTSKAKENLRSEVRILKTMDHPNIVKFFDVHDEPKLFYIFTRKMQTDMLEEIIGSPMRHLTERTTRFLVIQIVEAVRYLHSEDVAHCDLKPENVLLENVLSKNPLPCIQLCDFGYARIMTEASERKSTKGTPQYSPLELLLKLRHDRNVDLWSIGVIMFVSLTGTFPFEGNESEEIAADMQRKLKKPGLIYNESLFSDVSKDGLKLLQTILSKNYSRLDVAKILVNSWFYDKQLQKDLNVLETRLKRRIYTKHFK